VERRENVEAGDCLVSSLPFGDKVRFWWRWSFVWSRSCKTSADVDKKIASGHTLKTGRGSCWIIGYNNQAISDTLKND
jgi:hypothetical protein